jgi:phenazine biosynthesis protein phzE
VALPRRAFRRPGRGRPGTGRPGRHGRSQDGCPAYAPHRLAAGRPTFAVCLGHQILAALLGLPLYRRPAPYQGLARDIDLFGSIRRVGFYSSFTARSDGNAVETAYGPVEIARDSDDGTVHALRGRGFAGVQFHPESVLSRDGMAVLSEVLLSLLADVVSPARTG